MVRTLPILSFVLLFVLALTGCKKDDLVASTGAELLTLATELNEAVSKAEDKKKGVADAQKILDGKKADLKTKMDEVKELRGFQVSEEAMAKFQVDTTAALGKVMGLKISLAMADKETQKAGDDMIAAFTAIVQ